ncbi:hypothetical protein CLV51_103625 [Chitinophaga niastensis]|uniref:Uncharacterized protein n=1 Tax=Chitinophaga niastensis TaxID=536980 RepID=A0A2P8HKA3_CHINA|nr:hypothetical protein CLV51_103625 [Chitinophaga niastensis]
MTDSGDLSGYCLNCDYYDFYDDPDERRFQRMLSEPGFLGLNGLP